MPTNPAAPMSLRQVIEWIGCEGPEFAIAVTRVRRWHDAEDLAQDVARRLLVLASNKRTAEQPMPLDTILIMNPKAFMRCCMSRALNDKWRRETGDAIKSCLNEQVQENQPARASRGSLTFEERELIDTVFGRLTDDERSLWTRHRIDRATLSELRAEAGFKHPAGVFQAIARIERSMESIGRKVLGD